MAESKRKRGRPVTLSSVERRERQVKRAAEYRQKKIESGYVEFRAFIPHELKEDVRKLISTEIKKFEKKKCF